MPRNPKPRNVKSSGKPAARPPALTADAHERGKDFLTENELDQFLKAARDGRHGTRDHVMALLSVRHALRVSELIELRLADFNLDDSNTATINVHRLKGSLGGFQAIEGDELRAIKAWLRDRAENTGFDHLFLTERRQPFTRQGVNYLMSAIAKRAGLHHVHPHMLKHTCGFLLTEKDTPFRQVQVWMGHREPANTARYTRVSTAKFRGLWRRKGKP